MALKWGIAGPGKISSDFHRAVTLTLPSGDHDFLAVASRDLGRAQEFAKKRNISTAYGSYEELANDPKIEAVYIGTVHITHVELCKMMLNAGKHVLCEKPMALNSRQVNEVLTLAEEKKLFFLEAVWSRFFPLYDRIRTEIADGVLGDVRLVTACFCIPIAHVERLAKKEMGGGGLMDIGLYTVQLATMVFDEMPEKITAEGCLTAGGVDDNACVILKFKNGNMASLVYHMSAGIANNRASITGTKGTIEIASPFWCPNKITTPTGTYETEFSQEGFNYGNSAGLAFQAKYMREAIKKGLTECPQMSHRHSRIQMSITDEIRKQLGVRYDVDDQ